MGRRSGSVLKQLSHRLKEAVDHVSEVKTAVFQSDEFADARVRVVDRMKSMEFKGGGVLKLAGLALWKVLGESRVVIPMVVQSTLDHLHTSLGKKLGVDEGEGDFEDGVPGGSDGVWDPTVSLHILDDVLLPEDNGVRLATILGLAGSSLDSEDLN